MDMPKKGRVMVAVNNMLGQKAAAVRKELSAGHDQSIEFDGSQLSSGQYFSRVRVELESETVRETGHNFFFRLAGASNP